MRGLGPVTKRTTNGNLDNILKNELVRASCAYGRICSDFDRNNNYSIFTKKVKQQKQINPKKKLEIKPKACLQSS